MYMISLFNTSLRVHLVGRDVRPSVCSIFPPCMHFHTNFLICNNTSYCCESYQHRTPYPTWFWWTSSDEPEKETAFKTRYISKGADDLVRHKAHLSRSSFYYMRQLMLFLECCTVLSLFGRAFRMWFILYF